MKLSAARVGWNLASSSLWYNDLGIPLDLSAMSSAMLKWHFQCSVERLLAREMATRYADPLATPLVLVPPLAAGPHHGEESLLACPNDPNQQSWIAQQAWTPNPKLALSRPHC